MLTGNEISGDMISDKMPAVLIEPMRHPSLFHVFATAAGLGVGSHMTRPYAEGRLIWNGMSDEWDGAVLLEGVVQIDCMSLSGHSMRVATLIAPSYLNLRVLGRTAQLAMILTAHNSCTFAFGDEAWFLDRIARHPGAIMTLIESMILFEARLHRAAEHAVTSRLLPKVAEAILEANRDGGSQVRLTHQQIADIIGARRPSVTRALLSLRKLGLVVTRRRRIEVCDVVGLSAIVA